MAGLVLAGAQIPFQLGGYVKGVLGDIYILFSRAQLVRRERGAL